VTTRCIAACVRAADVHVALPARRPAPDGRSIVELPKRRERARGRDIVGIILD
jgi:hypothetical protein